MAKRKGGILTLLFSFLLLLLALAGFSYVLFSEYLPKSILKAVEPYVDFIVANLAVTGTGRSFDPLIIPSAFLLVESFLTFFYRRRKPYSLFFSLYLYLPYFTFLAFFHLEEGIATPVWMMSRIDMSKRPLLAVLIFLELILGIVIKHITTTIDRKHSAPAIRTDIETGEEVILDSDENDNVDRKSRRKEKKEIRRAQKERAAQEARERKETEKAQKELEKEEKAYARSEEKRKAKEEKKAARKAKKENRDLEEGESFSTNDDFDVPMPSRAPDGSSPLDFPEISEIPRMDTIDHVKDIDKVNESDYDRMQRRLGLKEESDVKDAFLNRAHGFVVDPADLPFKTMDNEDEFTVPRRRPIPQIEETEPEPELRYDPRKKINHYKSGGMLEATIESLNDYKPSPDAPVTPDTTIRELESRRPIGEVKNETPAPRKDDFAPSNLRKDHPRYKLFESLRDSGPTAENMSISHVPSMPFKPETESQRPVENYESTFIRKEEQGPKLYEKLSKMQEDSLDNSNPRVNANPGLSSFDRDRINSATRPSSVGVTPTADPFTAGIQSSGFSFNDGESYRPKYEDKPAPEREPEPSYSPEPDYRPEPGCRQPEPEVHKPPRAEDIPSLDERNKGRYDDGSDYVKQENELQYTFGIVGLESNNSGMTGIRERASMRYTPPSREILKDYPTADREIDEYTLSRGEIIVDTLRQFKVEVTLDNITKGPTVTMYEIKLAEGTPVSKVKCRHDDLCYNLGLGENALRILAPIPGKQAIGFEIPNRNRSVIGFKDMLYAFDNDEKAQKFKVPMILGRTITGAPVSIDVAKTPHLLIAGSTGSGKSVGINSFIATLLYKKSPRDVRLILIDPKVVELTMYNGIPHLLTPVITESKKVQKILAWLVEEMERRYKMISMFSVRNIETFNQKLKDEHLAAEKLPYIVLIMDEYADLMATIGKDIEFYIGRLTAMARAVGIHLVLATQRPSADVITGTIKNNIPSRIAFAVSSGVNSRVILDEIGAEALLGKGDMLYKDAGSILVQRIQGAFLSDKECELIVDQVKQNGEPDYLDESIFEDFDDSDSGDDMEDDPFDPQNDSEEQEYAKALSIVYEKKSASASYLQRRMKIGYNKAARYVERMEEEGIVGPPNGSKPRELLKML